HVGEGVTVRGWVYHTRSKGKLAFLVIRDGTGVVQAVAFRPELGDEQFALAEHATQESSVIATGTVREDPRAPGGYELALNRAGVPRRPQAYPTAPKGHGVASLMAPRPLWLRSSRQPAILRVRAEIIAAARQFLDDNGFVLVDAPILTPAAC